MWSTAASLLVALPVAAGAGRYNVLYLLADDLRPEFSEAYGQNQVLTPNIDKLAAGGLVFNKAYCQQSVCGPSRNSFMTGRRPHRTNVVGTDTGEDFRKVGMDVNGPGSNWITMPEHFKQNDFTTLGGGKTFHENYPKNFDYPTSWSTDMPYYDFSYWLTNKVTNVTYTGACPGVGKPTPGEAGDQCMGPRGCVAGPIAVWCALEEPDEHFYDHGLASNTIERLRYAAKAYKEQGTPFYIHSGFARPHTPWRVPQRFWDLYDTDKIELPKHKLPPNGMPGIAWLAHSFFNATTGDTWPLGVTRPLDDGITRLARHAYYASVSWLDHQVGRILDELDVLGLTDETIVVFHGDHGWQLGEHNSWHKYTNFEIGTRVPLIIRAPMREASVGQTTDALAELVDLYPTLAELAGTAAPSDVLDGVSLAPFFDKPARLSIPTSEAQGTLNKTVAFSQFMHTSRFSADATCKWFRDGACQDSPSVSGSGNSQWMGFSARDQRWRYTAWIPYNGTRAQWTDASSPQIFQELYDHNDDPGTDFDQGDDVVNLAYEPSHADTASAMFELVRNFFEVVAPPMPEPPQPPCESMCTQHSNPWTVKCGWVKCTGCQQCPAECYSGCAGNDKPWTEKCNWAGCSACESCSSQGVAGIAIKSESVAFV